MRAKTKTLAEILSDGYVYPEGVDDLTKATIFDWFQYRHVTDNERFGTYFNRVLDRDYHRYRQMMRVEPGVQGDSGTYTNFDWLVTEYLERLEQREYNGTREEDNTVEISGTSSGTGSQTHGGTTRTVTDGSGSTTHGLTVTSSSTNTGETDSTSHDDSASTAETRAGALSRTQPNSQSYTSTQMSANDNRRGYINDKTEGYNAGEKAEPQGGWSDDDAESHTVGLHKGFPDLDIKNPTSSSDTHTTAASIGSNKGSNHSETSDTASSTTANSGTDRTTHENDTTVTHGQTVSTTNSGTTSQDTTGHSESTDESTGTTKTRHTGRNGEIAEILTKAKGYIESTSAWDWFRGQLETCFMANLDY